MEWECKKGSLLILQISLGNVMERISLGDFTAERIHDRDHSQEVPSLITQKYLNKLETLSIQGNFELKDTIRSNILRAESNNQGSYTALAEKLSVTIDQLKSALQKNIENLVESSNFFRAMNVNDLRRAFELGKIQSVIGGKTGMLDSNMRRDRELEMFGIDIHSTERPIYGFLSDNEHGVVRKEGLEGISTIADYGNVIVKFKRDVIVSKATITFHDSLASGSNCPPTPAGMPHFTSFPLIHSKFPERFFYGIEGTGVANWGESYAEAQYHGGLSAENIESIHIASGIDSRELMEVRNIVSMYKGRYPGIELFEFGESKQRHCKKTHIWVF